LNLDEMLARVTTLNATNTTQARTYLTDALGSVMAQTQDNQSTLAGYSYSPYGQTQSTGNTEGDSVQYTGRENDNNGLYYYYRARYYDPVLKRFLSEDPIGLAGGSLSFYSYVGGNPVMFTDPEGKFAIPLVPPPPPMNNSGGKILPPDEGWPDGFDYPPSPKPNYPEIRVPSIPPKVPKGPGTPKDPDGGGACHKAFEDCMKMPNSPACPSPAKTPLRAMCFAMLIGCLAATGGDQ
ncbi:MAG: RHS repeat-associated core domain-containing protein, partial [Burkholderiales bacterium]|nr:RHS repeat-associated core domain-containing protein [Burkholderiales bacterium]